MSLENDDKGQFKKKKSSFQLLPPQTSDYLDSADIWSKLDLNTWKNHQMRAGSLSELKKQKNVTGLSALIAA